MPPVSDLAALTRPPSRPVALAVSAGLVLLWAFLRLVVFHDTLFPLTYDLPLLVCIWTRNRLALWSMAAAFVVTHLVKVFWVLPAAIYAVTDVPVNVGATLTSIALGALVIHAVIGLRERLEAALRQVQAQAEELRAQSEELAQQNEELSQQAEELSQQTEELSQQSEELAVLNESLREQGDEISVLNVALTRRERLLDTLLDTTWRVGAEQATLQHIADAAVDLFAAIDASATVTEATAGGWERHASAPPPLAEGRADTAPDDPFAALVVAQNRTTSLDDTALRPELAPAATAAAPRSLIGAPIRRDGLAVGALVIRGAQPRTWTDEDFKLVEWLAAQCGRTLQALRLETDLRDADQRKAEFLATLSHELRNPLAPIGFALTLLERGVTQDGKVLQVIQRQFQQLVRLVDDVLDATRLSSNKVQVRKARLDFVPIVQHALDAARPGVEQAALALEAHLPATPVWLDADAERLGQVVANLLNNAVRYTPRDGRVTVRLAAGGDGAVLSVADTGIGLARADLTRVFEMFTQVGGPGSGGLGIGLAIVRGIVALHGGRVEALSDGVGHGCEFRITVPLATVAADALAPTPAADGPRADRRRILVVDDNIDAATTLSMLLEMHGHDVWVAHDAQSALDTAHGQRPDIGLLDIGLPGLDGYELARQLRAGDGTRHMKLIAVTGWGQDGDRRRAREAGFDGHLTKPAEPGAVLQLLFG